MPARRQDVPTDATTSEGASKAALFVTYYVPLEKAPSLYDRLRSLARASNPASDCGQELPDSLLVGKPVDLPAAHDAAAIRLILNAPGDAAVAWEAMRRRLQVVSTALDKSEHWWGYTIVYQAVLTDSDRANVAFRELLPSVRRIDDPSVSLQPLATVNLSGGQLWLVDIPQQGDGTAAASIYVALSTAAAEDAFKRAFLGPKLLMADLIAHKGYFLGRQYRGDVHQDYSDRLAAFWEASDELLTDLSQRSREAKKRDRLARTYSVLVKVVSKLNRINVSMAQQLQNYDTWRRHSGDNDVVEYHYGYLEMASRELELMVTQGKDALEVANTAMSMTQVELDKELERRQTLIGDLLAVVGAGLAIPELVNHDLAKALWGYPGGDKFRFDAFLIQIVAIVVTAVLIASAARLLYWWRKPERASTGRL